MIETQDHGGIVELRLARPPVNALNPELFAALSQALDAAVRGGARGIVLSGRPGMFTAGLDVPGLLVLDEAGMLAAWQAFFGVNRQLAECPVPVAAAITGHSPAGGCVLAVFCDYRVMAEGDFRIGLNEVQVGLFPGPAIYRAFARLVGPRRAELYLTTGALLDPRQALAAGLVDEVVPPDQVVARSVAWLQGMAALPRQAMQQTRHMTREDLHQMVAMLRPEAVAAMNRSWFAPETQVTLRALADKLRKPRG
jgi:enoyl-CoA hydratase/carnithine racemase